MSPFTDHILDILNMFYRRIFVLDRTANSPANLQIGERMIASFSVHHFSLCNGFLSHVHASIGKLCKVAEDIFFS